MPRPANARPLFPRRKSTRARRIASMVGWVLALAVAPSVAPNSVWAGPGNPHAPSDPAQVEYEKHMDNGVKLYQSGDLSGALIEFDAAYKAKPKASPLINEGLCYRDQHKYPEAVAVLEKALRDHADSMDKKNRQATETAIADMRELFAFLTITVEPVEATVTVDGEAKNASQLTPLALGPDTHLVVVDAPGFTTRSEKVTLAAGDKRAVVIKLESMMGALDVTAQKRDTPIEIDGKIRGMGSFHGPVPAGGHSVRLVGESDTEPVDVAVGGTTTIDRSKGAPELPPIPVMPKPKPAPPPPPHGAYGLITGALLFTPAAPCAFVRSGPCVLSGLQKLSRNAGGAGGLRIGYRVNTFAAFEGIFEYGNVTGGIDGKTSSYSLSNIRIGPFLRLMSPGKLFHFVGTLGGGLALDFVKFSNPGQLSSCIRDNAYQCFNSWGVDFFVATDVGVELDIERVLVGASINVTGNALKGIDANPSHDTSSTTLANQFDNRAALFVGPRLHFGYATW